MSLDAILAEIRAAGAAEIREIEMQAQSRVREILASARIDAQQVEEQTCLEVVSPAYKERARILHKARLEALRLTGGMRESLVDAALDRTRGRLASIRNDRVYPSVLCQLTEEAIEEIQNTLENSKDELRDGNILLEVDPHDDELMENVFLNLLKTLPIRYILESWGGLIAKSEDTLVVVTNTLEARLERATPYLRHHLAALFEEEIPEHV
jgi:vacuolar-type H+-ATPase subunit E/Vma4